MDTDPTNPLPNDPITATENAASVGTDVFIGPGERIPEIDGERRPGQLGEDPQKAPAPGRNPGSHPDNPGDDPDVATPRKQPDVQATDHQLPATESEGGR